MVEMSAQLPGDYWGLEHYMAELPGKWELSSAMYEGDTLCAFQVLSEKEESLHVNRIVIAASHHKKGLGKLLIAQALDRCRQRHKPYLTLKVDLTNTNAIDFYKRLNFEVTGEQAGGLLLMRTKA